MRQYKILYDPSILNNEKTTDNSEKIGVQEKSKSETRMSEDINSPQNDYTTIRSRSTSNNEILQTSRIETIPKSVTAPRSESKIRNQGRSCSETRHEETSKIFRHERSKSEQRELKDRNTKFKVPCNSQRGRKRERVITENKRKSLRLIEKD